MDDPIALFKEHVKLLYQHVENWLKDSSLQTEYSTCEIEEEGYSIYDVQVLKVIDEQKGPIATFKPIGFRIIGADGRVDIVGKYHKEPVVYLVNDGPRLQTEIQAGEHRENIHRSLFKGVDADGWYWVGNPTINRAYPLDEQMLSDLIDGVSDYAIRKPA